ncbi:glycosyltransferase [Chryseobacterium sp. SNU WT5]|uniref:glycosyltransferase n=1 Tax=Chryseobacterium sp. SNU WT5 TaxID=2594269 RepID=UPI001180BB1E|nr:glycosyltransferase [Chryseobacterium sp. SNU WT5]QDP85816.1 glycosyltransferase [Chryseobacterium sp. SNU WT5]
MTKILFLIPTLMHGGAEKVLVNLVNNLDPNKYEITLYSIFDGGVNKEFLKSHVHYRYKFKKVFRGNSQVMKLFSPKFLYRFFIKENYNVVVSFLEGPAARIISGCNDPKTKKVAWIHSDMLTHNLAAVGFKNFAEAQKLYNKFDLIAGVSKNVVDSFQKIFNSKVFVQVLYNVNETENIQKLGTEKIVYNFSENIIKICSVGKITGNKGFDRLLEAHHRLLSAGLIHQIYILGIGEDQIPLKKRIKELGVEQSFTLLGFHKNPYQYMSKCDLYVCSSHREGFSTSVTEALILGVPVISTEVSGAKELLGKNNEYGIVTENTTEGIYQGLQLLLGNPQKLSHYKIQAELRGKEFSKEKTVIAVEQLFDSMLHE